MKKMKMFDKHLDLLFENGHLFLSIFEKQEKMFI